MITLRPASDDDCALLWQWANDPAVRAAAFQQAAIAWPDHLRWFATRVRSADCTIYIVTDETGCAVGQVRFEIDTTGAALVDISLAAEKRGTGLGTEALRAASRAFRQRSPARIEALIRPENDSSLRAFTRAGYVTRGIARVAGVEAVRMEFVEGGDR